jgi:hypothetical protein
LWFNPPVRAWLLVIAIGPVVWLSTVGDVDLSSVERWLPRVLPWEQDEGRVHGRVVGHGGAPLAGVLIRTADRQVTTSADGTFEIWRRPGSVALEVRAAGYATQRTTAEIPGRVDLALVPEAMVHGRVTIASRQEPVPGAFISLHCEGFDYCEHTATDATGSFRIRGLAPGRYAISASARGLGTSREFELAVGQSLELLIEGEPLPSSAPDL